MSLPWFIKYPNVNDEILNLDFVLRELDSFRKTFEGWAETIASLQEALKDIDDWEDRIEALEKISSQIPAIEKSLSDLYNLHDVDIKAIKLILDNLQSQIDNLDVSALRIYVDSRDNMIIADFNKKLYQEHYEMISLFEGLKVRIEMLANLIAELDTKALNPWPRRLSKESLENNLKFAYSDLADLVPTAAEYAQLGLSANDYDMLARDYSVRGKILLKMFYVYSPVYGFKQDINNVLTSIVNFIKGTISADAYTSLDLDADAYTALNLSADDYYSYNNQLGYIATGGSGLTSEQYSSLQIV